MKNHNSKVSTKNFALDSFLLVKIPSQELTKIKGGNDGDIIIIEDPVV